MSHAALKWVDTHAHLTSNEIYPDVERVLERAKAAGVERIVNICTDAITLQRGLELVKDYPWVFNTAATTPHDVAASGDSFFSMVEECALTGQLVAIGETGLDYYYQDLPKALQEAYLLRYFDLAKRAGLPVVFHCREAFEALFALADRHYAHSPALLHCFTGSLAEAKEVLERGWYLSISGIATFTKSEALREVAAHVPLNRLMLETDAPYLAPHSKRGKQNESAFMVETARVVAEVKGISLDELAAQTWQNAVEFFSFSKVM